MRSRERSSNAPASAFGRILWRHPRGISRDSVFQLGTFSHLYSCVLYVIAMASQYRSHLCTFTVCGKLVSVCKVLRQMDKTRLKQFMTTKRKARAITLALPVAVINWRWMQIDNLLSPFTTTRTQKENRWTHICGSQHWRIPHFCCAVHNILKIGEGARRNSNSRKKY